MIHKEIIWLHFQGVMKHADRHTKRAPNNAEIIMLSYAK